MAVQIVEEIFFMMFQSIYPGKISWVIVYLEF